jgi:hypothetical protein
MSIGGGGGLGNVDPRQQQNPNTASPFGNSISRPMTQDVMSPSSFPAPSVYGRPMQMPYGQPMQMPYGIPRPMGLQGQPMMPMRSLMPSVEPHTHGENGEIIQTATPRPMGGHPGYRGPDLQYNPGDQDVRSLSSFFTRGFEF